MVERSDLPEEGGPTANVSTDEEFNRTREIPCLQYFPDSDMRLRTQHASKYRKNKQQLPNFPQVEGGRDFDEEVEDRIRLTKAYNEQVAASKLRTLDSSRNDAIIIRNNFDEVMLCKEKSKILKCSNETFSLMRHKQHIVRLVFAQKTSLESWEDSDSEHQSDVLIEQDFTK
jgi:hypothetical protein